MKATGIVRRVDDLGRIVIPKEIRTTMNIKEGEPMELYVDKDGIVLKKYQPQSAAEWAAEIVKLHKGHIMSVTFVGDETMIVMKDGTIRKARRSPADAPDYNIGVAVCLCRHLKMAIPDFV